MARRELYLFIFFIALSLRLYYLSQMIDSPLFNFPLVDEKEYDLWAREILSGKLLWNTVPYHGPLYPYLLAFWYKLAGTTFFAGRLLGALLASAIAVLAAHISIRSIGRTAGIAAGLLVAVYWPFIYWSGELIADNLALFLNLMVFWMLLKAQDDRRPLSFFLSGIFAGLSAAARPNIIMLIPLFFIWILLIAPPKRAISYIASLALGAALIVCPISLQNYCVSGEFVLIQAHMGINLYQGMNPDITSVYGIQPGIVWDKWMLEPIRLNLFGSSEQDKYWIEKTIAIISHKPWEVVKHIFKNTLLIFSQYEMCSSKDVLYNKNFAPFVFSLPGFWLIGPLGIAGAVAGVRRFRELGLHYIFLAGIIVSSIPFQPFSRYRLSLAVFLIIFSAIGLSELKKRIISKDLRGIALFGLALVLSALTVRIDVMGMRQRDLFITHLNCARAALEEQDPATAISHIRQASRLRPDDPEMYKLLGDSYLSAGRLAESEQAYSTAVKLEPDFFRAVHNLGVIKLAQRDIEGAIEYFKKAVLIYPYYDLAIAQLERCEKMKKGS